MAYEDTVLIKLRRDYAKDEVVMFSLNKIKELQIEIGKDKAYISELEESLLKKQKPISNDGKVWFEKYNEIKKRFDLLNAKQFQRTINSLEKRLKKQYIHGVKLECKKTFLRHFIKDNIPNVEIFYAAEREFDKENENAELKVIPINI